MACSAVNINPGTVMTFFFSFILQSNDDMISGVELLAYIPYFVAVAPKDA